MQETPSQSAAGQLDERLRRTRLEVGSFGEPPNRTQRERERRLRGQHSCTDKKDLLVDVRRIHERKQDGDMRGNAQTSRPVVLLAQRSNERLGLRNEDNEGGLGHERRP